LQVAAVAEMMAVHKQVVDLVVAAPDHFLALTNMHSELIHYKHNMAQLLPAVVAGVHRGVVKEAVEMAEAEL
jgi:hypothetical protein